MIAIAGLSVDLGGRRVLDGVCLDVGPGELVCCLGPNGAGKSTLLRAVVGLVPITGSIRLAGQEMASLTPREKARMVSFLPQRHEALWPITVTEAVSIGRFPHRTAAGGSGVANDHRAVAAALAAVDAGHLAHRRITDVSGGERARVMLARALAVEATLLLADEPTAALDPAHQLAVIGLLRRLADEGRTVLAALHDLTLAARFATRAVILAEGRLVADGPPADVLTPDLLNDVFGLTAARLQHDGNTVIVPWSAGASPGAQLRR